DNRQGAHRLVAVLEPFVAGTAVSAGRAFDHAAALTLLRLGDALRNGRRRGQNDTHRRNDGAAETCNTHRAPPALTETDVSVGIGAFITSAGSGFEKFEDRRSIGPPHQYGFLPAAID